MAIETTGTTEGIQLSSGEVSDAAIPPGLLIRDELKARGLSQRKLAQAMDRPVNAIAAIIAGRKAITPRTAIQLEEALEMPAHLWLGLEARYRLALERIDMELERTGSD